MNATKLEESRITRRLVQRSSIQHDRPGTQKAVLAERVIFTVAGAAALCLLGLWSPEMLAAVLAGCIVLSLGTRNS